MLSSQRNRTSRTVLRTALTTLVLCGLSPASWLHGQSLPLNFARQATAASVATESNAATPWVDSVDSDSLRLLMTELKATHGPRYRQGPQHLQRLETLQQALAAAAGDGAAARRRRAKIDRDLAQLQRDVLLFDVDRLIVIKRFEITASHVYTYHYEGFKAGGGLYVVSPGEPDGALRQLVSSPTGQILDCDLSHNGQTILFSWRQPMARRV